MTPFSALLASVVPGEAGSSAVVPPDWMQGRSTFGGLTAAISLAAARERAMDPPPLRSAQFAFTGPVDGAVHLETEVLRRGRSSVFVGVDAVCDHRLSARALFLFAEGRESSVQQVQHDMPDVPSPDECPDFFEKPGAPEFTRHFEARLALGSPLLSGASDPSFHGWVRHCDTGAAGLPPMTRLIALADVLPPPVLALPTEMSPISTMTCRCS